MSGAGLAYEYSIDSGYLGVDGALVRSGHTYGSRKTFAAADKAAHQSLRRDGFTVTSIDRTRSGYLYEAFAENADGLRARIRITCTNRRGTPQLV